MKRITVAAILLVLAVIPVFAQDARPGKTEVVIGVVLDGPPAGGELIADIEAELAGHLPIGTSARFMSKPSYNAGWDVAQVPGALASALEDPEADMVLVTGPLATAAAADIELQKPVVSAFLQRAEVFRMPFGEEDRSLQPKLVFMVLSQSAERDVEAFRSLAPFETLHILVGDEIVAGLDLSEAQLRTVSEALGVRIETVPVPPDVDPLAALGSEVEAAYLAAMPRYTTEARKRLIEGLTERGIPSFSLIGHPDVERGALAGLKPDTGQQVVRRVALNLSRLIRGEEAADLPVLLRVDSSLLINGRTAAALGLSLGNDTRLFASFLQREALEPSAEKLTLAEARKMAEERNTTLAVQDAVTESAREDAAIAKSFMLPQLGLDVSSLATDSQIAFTNAGVSSDGSTRGNLSLRQMIYDDRTVSGHKTARRLAEGSEADLESVRLDVISDAGRAYLSLEFAKSLLEVDLRNLSLSEDNLEIAQLREEVGYSGRDEVLRWEAVVADNRSAVYRSAQDVETARIALNQILNVDQDRRWRSEEVPVDPERLTFLDGRLAPVFGDPAGWRRVRAAVTEVAEENSPEILALSKTAEAQQVQVARAKRAYYLPTFSAGATYSDEIIEGDSSLPLFGDDFYTVTIDLSYPIFQGGLKASESAKARVDLEAAERRLELARELVGELLSKNPAQP
jgi:outer membrane protein TolC